jgi:hypothetical protein
MFKSTLSSRVCLVLALTVATVTAGVLITGGIAATARKAPTEIRVVTVDVAPGGGADVPPQGDSVGDSDTFTKRRVGSKDGQAPRARRSRLPDLRDREAGRLRSAGAECDLPLRVDCPPAGRRADAVRPRPLRRSGEARQRTLRDSGRDGPLRRRPRMGDGEASQREQDPHRPALRSVMRRTGASRLVERSAAPSPRASGCRSSE